jgi:hypothetical protein
MGVVTLVSWCLALPLLFGLVLTPGVVFAVLSFDGALRVMDMKQPARRSLRAALWTLSCMALLSITAGVVVGLFRTLG